MTHSILLVVEKPKVYDRNTDEKWKACIKHLSDQANKNEELQLISENFLLLSLNHTLNTLSEVLWEIQGQSYRYSIFCEDVQWLSGSMEIYNPRT